MCYFANLILNWIFQLYLNDRLQLFYSRVLKFFLQSGLLLLSLVCGLLRVYDNKHHLSDVIAGFAIGITVAVAVVKCFNIMLFIIRVVLVKLRKHFKILSEFKTSAFTVLHSLPTRVKLSKQIYV